jgi:hypothetical protein
VTLRHLTSATTLNDRGDLSSPTYSDTTPTGVIQQLDNEDLNLIQSGFVNAGAIKVYLPYSVTVETNDLIVVDSKTWRVVGIVSTGDNDNTAFVLCYCNPN